MITYALLAVIAVLLLVQVLSWVLFFRMVTQLTNKIIAPTTQDYLQIVRAEQKPLPPVAAKNPPKPAEFIPLSEVPDEDLFAALNELPQ